MDKTVEDAEAGPHSTPSDGWKEFRISFGWHAQRIMIAMRCPATRTS